MATPLVRNALHLLTNAGLTSGIGFLFWGIAARLLPPAQVGVGAALVSAMMLLALAGKLGFDYALVRILPQASAAGRARALDTFVTGTALASAALSIAFVLAAQATGLEVGRALANPAAAALFILGTVAVAELTLLDGLFLAHEQAGWITGKNLAASILKAAFVLPLALHGGVGVMQAWALASTITLLALIAYLSRTPAWAWRPRARMDPGILRASARLTLGNFAVHLAETSPAYLLPIIAAERLSATDAGLFYVAWMIASVIYFIPVAAATSYYARASRERDPGAVRAALAKSLKFCALLTVPACLGALLLGRFALAILRPEYAEGATVLLRVLVAAAPLVAVNLVWTAVLRTRDRVAAFAAFSGGIAAVTLVLAVPFAAWGVAGMGMAWLAAHAAFAGGSLPGLVREMRGRVLQQRYPASNRPVTG